MPRYPLLQKIESKQRVFTCNPVQLECTRPTDTGALKIIEIFSGIILKNYVFLVPFTCLTFNAAHQGTAGKVAVVLSLLADFPSIDAPHTKLKQKQKRCLCGFVSAIIFWEVGPARGTRRPKTQKWPTSRRADEREAASSKKRGLHIHLLLPYNQASTEPASPAWPIPPRLQQQQQQRPVDQNPKPTT